MSGGALEVAGWSVLADYAEPATAGGGYCELLPSGEFKVAYEAESHLREMGVDYFLVTTVPVEVVRTLLARYDADRAGEEVTQPSLALPVFDVGGGP